MKLDLVPLSPAEESSAWSWFARSPAKDVVHNEMVRQILTLRDKLEAATPEQVPGLQAEIKAHRFLLGLIHRKDNLPTK